MPLRRRRAAGGGVAVRDHGVRGAEELVTEVRQILRPAEVVRQILRPGVAAASQSLDAARGLRGDRHRSEDCALLEADRLPPAGGRRLRAVPARERTARGSLPRRAHRVHGDRREEQLRGVFPRHRILPPPSSLLSPARAALGGRRSRRLQVDQVGLARLRGRLAEGGRRQPQRRDRCGREGAVRGAAASGEPGQRRGIRRGGPARRRLPLPLQLRLVQRDHVHGAAQVSLALRLRASVLRQRRRLEGDVLGRLRPCRLPHPVQGLLPALPLRLAVRDFLDRQPAAGRSGRSRLRLRRHLRLRPTRRLQAAQRVAVGVGVGTDFASGRGLAEPGGGSAARRLAPP
mmetsp:Transcript_6494/g.19009  ORF Transcript_6494/g.19009 Transcript_6494/m.19009 type:complete len:345 (+) Transcript_6494:308-1342(+)